MWSSFEDQIDAAVNYVDAAIFAPANTWLRENVSVGGQYLALFLMLVVMALHLVWTKEKRTNWILSCMLFFYFVSLDPCIVTHTTRYRVGLRGVAINRHLFHIVVIEVLLFLNLAAIFE